MKTLLIQGDPAFTIFVSVVCGIVLIVLREALLWYWKINQSVRIQQWNLVLLMKMYEKQGGILTETERAEMEKLMKLMQK